MTDFDNFVLLGLYLKSRFIVMCLFKSYVFLTNKTKKEIHKMCMLCLLFFFYGDDSNVVKHSYCNVSLSRLLFGLTVDLFIITVRFVLDFLRFCSFNPEKCK